MKIFKDAQVKFQAERVGKCLNVAKFRGYRWWIAVILSRSEVMEQSETTMVSSLDVQFYPKACWDKAAPAHKEVQIITPVFEQILVNPAWIKKIIG